MIIVNLCIILNSNVLENVSMYTKIHPTLTDCLFRRGKVGYEMCMPRFQCSCFLLNITCFNKFETPCHVIIQLFGLLDVTIKNDSFLKEDLYINLASDK